MPTHESQPFAYIGRRGQRLGLRVEGYQYPRMRSVVGRDWDANWLMIGGRVDCEQGSWTFRDACLTTFELEALIAWFASLPRPDESCLTFIEPALSFAWIPHGERPLMVRLRCEALPADHADRWRASVELSFAADPKSLDRFVHALREHTVRFPQR